MKKLMLVLIVMAVLVAPVFGGTITIKALPSTLQAGVPGELNLEFWVEGVPAVGGIEVIPTFSLGGGNVSSTFSLKTDPANLLFNGYDVKHNTIWPTPFGFVDHGPLSTSPTWIFGFLEMSGIDKYCGSPTLMLTATYRYAQLEAGTYTVSLHPDSTGLVDISGRAPNQTFIPATFTVVPEPATIALLGVGLVGILIRRRK